MNPQAIVARPSKAKAAVYIILKFSEAKSSLAFLRQLQNHITFLCGSNCLAQMQLGITYRGFEVLDLPAPYLRILAKLSPSFAQGAALRAAYLGDTADSAPQHWPKCFQHDEAHAVLSIYGQTVEEAIGWYQQYVENAVVNPGESDKTKVALLGATEVQATTIPGNGSTVQRIVKNVGGHDADFVHFGYRDGLTRAGFDYSGKSTARSNGIEYQLHEPGEFLLGHTNNDGSNLWALSMAADKIRDFFRDASFGIVRQIEQDVVAFEKFISEQATKKILSDAAVAAQVTAAQSWDEKHVEAINYLKGKFCGRTPDGLLFDSLTGRPNSDLTLPAHDPENAQTQHFDASGIGCPFGAHIRRMNPRAGKVVHASQRPLIRRGMPYGPEWQANETQPVQRGLMALFFCASIESQFEHVLSAWADRLPMGFPGDRSGKDALIGNHESPAATFAIALSQDKQIEVSGFSPFVTTRGMVYALYLGKTGMELLLKDDLIKEEHQKER